MQSVRGGECRQAHDFNSADTVRVAMLGLRAAGLDPARELRRVGVDVTDVPQRIDRRTYCALWESMALASGQDDFGIRFVEHADAGLLGPLEWLATTAATLGEGLDALARCGRLLHTGGHYVLERSKREARFVYFPGRSAVPRAVLDWSFGYMTRSVRRVSPGDVRPSVVHLQYARPSRASRVEEALGAEVSFDAPLNALIFPREQLDAPLLTRDPELHTLLYSVCRIRCGTTTGFEQRVRTTLLNHLAREQTPPSIEYVARRLGASSRSIQRALQREGVSFRQLVLEARMEIAELWLDDPRWTIADVAHALGYSEPSAFQRAYCGHFGRSCRRDTGAEPAEGLSAHRPR